MLNFRGVTPNNSFFFHCSFGTKRLDSSERSSSESLRVTKETWWWSSCRYFRSSWKSMVNSPLIWPYLFLLGGVPYWVPLDFHELMWKNCFSKLILGVYWKVWKNTSKWWEILMEIWPYELMYDWVCYPTVLNWSGQIIRVKSITKFQKKCKRSFPFVRISTFLGERVVSHRGNYIFFFQVQTEKSEHQISASRDQQ